MRMLAITALVVSLSGCYAWQMTEGQFRQARFNMTLIECHERARAVVGKGRRHDVERVSYTHSCLRSFRE